MSIPLTKITLHTETAIDSCHRLNNYDGKCVNLHGHTWLIQVWIQGEDSQKDAVGILFDFGGIKQINEELDHKNISENPYFEKINPTAENITMYILLRLNKLDPELDYRVKVYETAVLKKTWCQRQTNGFDINYL